MASRSKLWPGLSVSSLASEDAGLNVIVRYRPSAVPTAPALAIEGASLRRHYRVFPMAAMRITAAGLRHLEADPTIEYIWPDLPVRAFLDKATPAFHVPEVWALGYTGEGIRVAILDTGIDANHPDLADRVAASTDLTGEGPHDGHGHGTHVAGIVAGTGAASGGRYKGVAPGARLYAAKVLGADGGGLTSTVIAGLEWAVEQGVQVVNLSLGSTGSSDGTDALSVACDTVVGRGIVVCVAAGNEGPGEYTIGSPGAARQPITVGACTLDGQVADFSSRGPTADGRVKPDTVLPGVSISSCRAAGTQMGAVVDACYTTASGTSMATPMASGLVALLLEAFPGLRPPEVKERLKRTAIDLGFSPYAQGAGRADALRAYQNEGGPEPPPPEPPPLPPQRPGCLPGLATLWRKVRP